MDFDFKLPDLGEGITEGEIVKWLVKAGDAVEEHQVIAEIETDKAIVEVPSPRKGVIKALGKGEGETVYVGETLAVVDIEGKAAPEPEEEAPPAEEPEERSAPSLSVVGTVPDREEILASPKARALAKKLGVEISKVEGTGPGGAITELDVRLSQTPGAKKAPPEKRPPGKAKATAAAPEEKKAALTDKWGPVEVVPIRGVRRSISKNLLASQRSAAFVTGMDEADVTRLWMLRQREKKVAIEKGVHITFLPFFMKAVQHAIAEHPRLNASVNEEGTEITVKRYLNIGVAVDTPDGLMVPVVKDVDKKTVLGLARELQALSEKARDRKLTLDELKGSSFTISNYGSFGGAYATPIINYPDVAILGTGRIAERPRVVDGKVEARRTLPLSLTFDHRVCDGVEAARFLNKVIGYLEDPESIFIESA
jgi:pyruvate dehydrogenase E2 component (dihydrolipoamide acetyltransferase)